MAIILNSISAPDTPVSIAQETFTLDFNGQTSAVITPTNIVSILTFTITPNSAAAATSIAPYAAAFIPGSATLTLTGKTTDVVIVTVYGAVSGGGVST